MKQGRELSTRSSATSAVHKCCNLPSRSEDVPLGVPMRVAGRGECTRASVFCSPSHPEASTDSTVSLS